METMQSFIYLDADLESLEPMSQRLATVVRNRMKGEVDTFSPPEVLSGDKDSLDKAVQCFKLHILRTQNSSRNFQSYELSES